MWVSSWYFAVQNTIQHWQLSWGKLLLTGQGCHQAHNLSHNDKTHNDCISSFVSLECVRVRECRKTGYWVTSAIKIFWCFASPGRNTKHISYLIKSYFGGCPGVGWRVWRSHHRPLSVARYRQLQDPAATKTRTRVRINSYHPQSWGRVDTHTYTCSHTAVLQCCRLRCADYWWKIMNGTNNNNTTSLLLAMQMPLALTDWWWWFYQIKIKYKIPLYEVHLFRNLSLAHVDCSAAARPPAQQQPAQSAAVRCADCRTSAAWWQLTSVLQTPSLVWWWWSVMRVWWQDGAGDVTMLVNNVK